MDAVVIRNHSTRRPSKSTPSGCGLEPEYDEHRPEFSAPTQRRLRRAIVLNPTLGGVWQAAELYNPGERDAQLTRVARYTKALTKRPRALRSGTVEEMIREIAPATAAPSAEIVALAERLIAWVEPEAQEEIRRSLPLMVESGIGGREHEERIALVGAEWLVHQLLPQIVMTLGELRLLDVLGNVPPVRDAVSLRTAANTCSLMIWLLEGSATTVLEVAHDALLALVEHHGDPDHAYEPGTFGRRLGDVVVAAALMIYGCGDEGTSVDGFGEIDWLDLLDLMLLA